MRNNFDEQPLNISLQTFAEMLKTALLFDPLNHSSQYVKEQEFRVISRGKFNASVTEHNYGEPLPGPRYDFNIGIWYALLDSVASICTNKYFFPEIEYGDVEFQESSDNQISRRFYDYTSSSGEKSILYPKYPKLIAEERQKLANQQLELAVKFISLHEQAHVFAGHLLYIKQFGSANLLEIAEEGNSTKSKQRQALELQADDVAFQALFRLCIKQIKKSESEPKLFNISSEVDWLIACISSTVIVCCLFEIADSIQAKSPHNRQHPSAKCRTLSIFKTFISIVINIVQTDEDLHKAIRRVLQNLGAIFEVLKVASLEMEAVKWSWKPSSTVTDCQSVLELLEIENILRSLEPELQKYQLEIQKKLSNNSNLIV